MKWLLLNEITVTSLIMLGKIPTVEVTNDIMNINLMRIMKGHHLVSNSHVK